MGDWLQDDKHDAILGTQRTIGGMTTDFGYQRYPFGFTSTQAMMGQARCPECDHTLGWMNISNNHEFGCSRIQAEMDAMRPAQPNYCEGMQNAYRPSGVVCPENLEAQRRLNEQLSALIEVCESRPFKRRSGWRLAIQRPRLFWNHWRLMKFSVCSIKAAFRLAMV